MAKQKDRIIIDTNLWISYLLSPNFRKLDYIISKKTIKLLFSRESLEELITVTQRPKFKKYFNPADVDVLLTALRIRSTFIDVHSQVDVCRDEKDNFLLALAHDGKATHLLTGDKDLLILKWYKKTQIISIEEYLRSK